METSWPRPVARLWELSGGGLHEPHVARNFSAELLSRIGDISRDRGRIVMSDPSRSLLRGLSVTDTPDAWVQPEQFLPKVGDLIRQLPSVTVRGPREYEVTYARFRGVHGRTPQEDEIEPMRARVAMLRGGDVTSLDVLGAVRHHIGDYVIHAPGCVAAFLLANHTRQALLAASIWADDHSAERTEKIGRESFDTIAASANSTLIDTGTYNVLVYDEPPPRSSTERF